MNITLLYCTALTFEEQRVGDLSRNPNTWRRGRARGNMEKEKQRGRVRVRKTTQYNATQNKTKQLSTIP
jgi:hypothetical protein